MNRITKLKGTPVNLLGAELQVGKKVPDFKLVATDLSEKKLSSYDGFVKIITTVPSLDTGVCAQETRTFNKEAAALQNTKVLVVSADLPFAMKRFCETEGIENVESLSHFRNAQFAEDYGTYMNDGPLQGLSARAVFVLDKNDILVYQELTDDITHEPNYAQIIEAAASISN